MKRKKIKKRLVEWDEQIGVIYIRLTAYDNPKEAADLVLFFLGEPEFNMIFRSVFPEERGWRQEIWPDKKLWNHIKISRAEPYVRGKIKPKHTSGFWNKTDWHFDESGFGSCKIGKMGTITYLAECYGEKGSVEGEANARLISAAPELQEANLEAIKLLDKIEDAISDRYRLECERVLSSLQRACDNSLFG